MSEKGEPDGYKDWNQLPVEVLGTLPCKPNTLKKRVRKAIIEVRKNKVCGKSFKSVVK
jgi:hypothetical protein